LVVLPGQQQSVPPQPPQQQQPYADIVSEGEHEDENNKKTELTDLRPSETKEEDKSVPLVYPIEIFVFSLIGYAWLSLREMLGGTPVLDAGVIISLLVVSTLNLAVSTLLPDKESFKPWAKSFAGHSISLWLLYLHSIIESASSDGSLSVCCGDGVKKDGISFSKVQAAVFFGGLLMHQIFAVITFAFLSVVSFVSLLQAKASHSVKENSTLRDWVPIEIWTSLIVHVLLHSIIFSLSSLTCRKFFELVIVVITLAVAVWLLMVDPAWIMVSVAKRKGRPYADSLAKKIEIVWFVLKGSFCFIGLVLAFVMISVLGQRVSASFIVLAVLYVVWFVVTLVRDLKTMKVLKQKENAEKNQPNSSTANSRLNLSNLRGGILQTEVQHGRTKKLR